MGEGARKRRQRTVYALTDWFTGNIAFLLFDVARHALLPGDMTRASLSAYLLSQKLLVEQLAVPVAMCGVFWLSGYYNQPFGKSRLQEFLTTLFSAAVNASLIYVAFMIDDALPDRARSYTLFATLFLLLFGCCYAGRFVITQVAVSRFHSRKWEMRTLVAGNSEVARGMARRLASDSARLSYRICGFVRIPGEKDAEGDGEAFELEDVARVCRDMSIDRVVIAPSTMDERKILGILKYLFPLGISVRIAPDTYSLVTSSVRLRDIYGDPFVDLTSPAISESSKNIKRAFDVAVSALTLLLFSPLYLAIAIAVRADSRGSVIYRQERIGLRQRPFFIYKFRSMSEGAEPDGPCLSSDGDPRVTRTGRFLRKYRLDELPQFWNVLRGDMSIVGPRPERQYYIDRIMETAPYYILLCQVRPGITSWGMVKYGYASSVSQMVERTRFDLIYLSNMSLSLDLKILIHTVRTVAAGKGK